MIYKNPSFWLHRQLLFGFLAISCLLITFEVETADGSFVRVYLKLCCFEEFLDYCNGKSSLDVQNLVRATTHLRDNSKWRRDYMELPLRQANWDECATEDEIVWPHKEEEKKYLLQGDQWEHNFQTSRFTSPKNQNWVHVDFLKSTMMFPLRSVMPYSKIYYFLSCAQVEQQFIYINLGKGKGFEFVSEFKRYLNRDMRKKLPAEVNALQLASKCTKLRRVLGKRYPKDTNSEISFWGNADRQLRKKPTPIFVAAIPTTLLNE